MQRASLLLALAAALLLVGTVSSAGPAEHKDDGFSTAEGGLAPAEMAGAEIWYKATAGSARFTTYTFQQRLGVLVDWYRILRADQQGERFKAWGLIHDPDCCVPGSAGCPAKSLEETYGFEYCRGDDELLAHVGKPGYRDPACDFKDPDGPGVKQSPCDLQFGTSTGALGLRKLPNPRFDPQRWRKVNGGRLGTWEGYARPLSSDPRSPDLLTSHLADASIEPPYLIGMACGFCHIAFDPLHPPKDPANPRWENLKGAVGNQYTQVSAIFASGMPRSTPEWQLFSHDRPGTVDTSAMPNDSVHNPGTMNAIINLAQRPQFEEQVRKWRPVASCPADADVDTCWCEPGQPGKCKERSVKTEKVFHILKGGEDSIGALEAIQRVYFNIGSCAEACWANHLTDQRQIDPKQRGFGQTEFEIGQCRRDCPNFRAVEDRLPDVAAFFFSRRPTDLWQARGLQDSRDLVEQLDQEFGKGAVDRGRVVFAQTCARCHSSQPAPFDNRDFLARDEHGDRIDWLGNDQPTLATEVGTYRCRALHSNHMAGHVFGQYASETYRARPGDPNDPDPSGGGRGYYRNISLINVWAYAPFMHNNALGPEVCGRPAAPAPDLYVSPYVEKTADGYRRLAPGEAPKCWPYDPSVEGRYALYKASMEELLSPETRVPKVTLIDEDVVIEFGLRSLGDRKIKAIRVRIPAGEPAGLLVSLDLKSFVDDLILAPVDAKALRTRLEKRDKAHAADDQAMLARLAAELPRHLTDGEGYRIARADAHQLLRLYGNCTADVENAGHTFGASLPAQDKKALIAYLATF